MKLVLSQTEERIVKDSLVLSERAMQAALTKIDEYETIWSVVKDMGVALDVDMEKEMPESYNGAKNALEKIVEKREPILKMQTILSNLLDRINPNRELSDYLKV